MYKVVKQAIFKIDNSIIGTYDATNHTIDKIIDMKCEMAIEHKVIPEDIEVEYKEDVIELGDTYITPSNKWCFDNPFWVPEHINSLSLIHWVNEKTEEGRNSIIDFISLRIFDELVIFNRGN